MSDRNASDYIQNKNHYFTPEQQLQLDNSLSGMFPQPLDAPRNTRVLTLYDFNEAGLGDIFLMYLFSFEDVGGNLWIAYMSRYDKQFGPCYLVARTTPDQERKMRHGEVSVQSLFMDADQLYLSYEDSEELFDYGSKKQELTDKGMMPEFKYDVLDTITVKGQTLHNQVIEPLAMIDVW